MKKLVDKKIEARKVIEALRLGIVPQKYVENFTFGREEELKQIKAWLENSEESSLILVGEYGVGKTHLLEYLYSFLIKNNWAVSFVELDPNELPFHKPKRIYEAITKSFRFRNVDVGFRDFLKEIARSNRFKELETHHYLKVAIDEIRNGMESEYTFEWIEGKPTLVGNPPMYDYSTCANIYCYILSGIGWASKNILGLNGFVILFDEAESVDSYWYTSYQNEKSWNFLKGILFTASNKVELVEEKISPFHIAPYGGKIYIGERTGLQYCGHLPNLRYIWKFPTNLKLIFAFSPSYNILEKEPISTLRKIEIRHIEEKYLREMIKSIIHIYEVAYEFKVRNRSFIEKLPTNKTRIFIKSLIEALDLMRYYPNESLEKLLI